MRTTGTLGTMSTRVLVLLSLSVLASSELCGSGAGGSLRYTLGNALTDSPDCMGPMGEAYPRETVERLVPNLDPRVSGRWREGRGMMGASRVMDVARTTHKLLTRYTEANAKSSFGESFHEAVHRVRREAATPPSTTTTTTSPTTNSSSSASCHRPDSLPPSRLCSSTFNTTAPMYGVSLTSGEPVTIVQKFPDLLQQVVFETCSSEECDVVHGKCVQTFVPYLFLVIPLGPVTLTGQDYVLVESGCTCQPRYAQRSDPDPSTIIPKF